MKKSFIVLGSLVVSAIFMASPVFAAATYPYSPSEVLGKFEAGYTPLYDQINADLHDAMDKAEIWSRTYALQEFTVGWADGTENGYSFKFIDVNNDLKALEFNPLLTGGFAQTEIDRTPDMRYGIYVVPMRLRQVIPAMKADKILMPSLDSLVKEGCNTSIRFTLKKSSLDLLTWFIEFRSSNESTDPKLTCSSYRVSVNAEKATDPVFVLQQLK